MSDIIADIDALIDEQLDAGEPEQGYDFNDPTFPKCGTCGWQWHGLPITRQMVMMRAAGTMSPDYRYADDESPVICPGSEVPWVMRPTGRTVRLHAPGLSPVDVARIQDAITLIQERFREIGTVVNPLGSSFRRMAERLGVEP